MTVFLKKGYFSIIERSSETNEQFQFRGYAIATQKPKKAESYKKCCVLSKYLVNMKYLGCVYDENMNAYCAKMEQDMMKEK